MLKQHCPSLEENKFWIVSARKNLHKIIFNCIICKRTNFKDLQQRMVDFPSARIAVTRAFCRTGVGYCGPYDLKNIAVRSKQVKKKYLYVFLFASLRKFCTLRWQII